jgi:Protein of unknown function (DUF4058)
MPLRDHFRPPLDNIATWEGFHGQWPAIIVQQLRKSLPVGYTAEPSVHQGTQVEVDISTYETESAFLNRNRPDDHGGGVATAVWEPTAPSLAVEMMLPDYDEYAVRIYDAKRNRELVAAIEIVSPANKDRPEKRNAFVAKCAALMQKGVAVSIVDLVTVKHFNLYAELLAFVGQVDPSLGHPAPETYAVSCRWGMKGRKMMLETWSHPLVLGQRLPTLPLWLRANLGVSLDLEQSYENACNDLWLT